MSESPTVLVVDDHRDIRDLVSRYLQEHGIRTLLAEGGVTMKRQLRDHAVDLVVLDIMMPGDDGLTLCRYLREHTELPVILLTAMSEETDRIIGLEMGADDYLTKPFNPRELLARIKAVLRRASALPPQRAPMAGRNLRFDGWTLDVDRHQLTDPEGVEVSLSTAEYRLLLAFLEHAGRVLSRDQLMDLTRGREADAFDRSIDNHVSRLRRKMDPDARHPRLIKTIWGGGYQWIADVEGAAE
ncbi:response regulator [Marinobacter oulmenensis]|uniref:Two-component system OmpR family response regulator n=1 Tax=Marinobacter oulmenensis TaxID=643747 RepID=A0A840UM95_9GAMM|nr:two-component system OmpR family response regulator [Marinobacter oulmenensis]